MNLTKKLFKSSFFVLVLFTLTACSYKSIEPSELQKAESISINGISYTPEYDSLDAYLLADEELVLGKQAFWYIHNNKLYLFNNETHKKKWFSQMSSMLEAANAQYALTHANSAQE